MKTISIATDYSRFPSGRYRTDGPNSGERCREELLVPALRANGSDPLEINLDGTMGYGSSFLEETFGGLVRWEGFRAPDLKLRLRFVTTEYSSYVPKIWEKIFDARPEKRAIHGAS